jgi:hypothetical protein
MGETKGKRERDRKEILNRKKRKGIGEEGKEIKSDEGRSLEI